MIETLIKSKRRVEIIAEIANSHNGNPADALNLAEECFLVGVDAVKFQIYFAEELLTTYHSRYEHFKNQSFSEDTWNDLFYKLKKKNRKIYADTFGIKALNLAQRNKLDGIKIHSSDLNNKPLLEKLKDKKKKYFLSCGGSTIEEIAYAVKITNKNGIKPILLHGFQAYPTHIEDTHLNRISTLKNIFKGSCDYGYQDHISGDDPMNLTVSQIALAYGANYIEKHVTLNRKEKGVDYYSSIEPSELKKFVYSIRQSEKSIGSSRIQFSSSEKKYRTEMKKFWVTKKKLKKNQILKKTDLIMKRIDKSNLHNFFIEDILGKKILQDIEKETIIKKSFFKNHVTALIVVRTASKRLPQKSLKKICGLRTIEHCIRRVKTSKKIDNIILCTTNLQEDKVLHKIAKKNKIDFYAGEVDDVLLRMINAVKKKKTDLIIRVTGDDILINPYYLNKTINFHLENNFDYTDNKSLPSGTEVEIFNKEVLKKIHFLAIDPSGTEYLTFYIKNNLNFFNTGSLKLEKKIIKILKLTLDTPADFKIIKLFLEEMNNRNKLFSHTLDDMLKFYKRNIELFKKNKKKIKGQKVNTDLEWKKILNYQS